MLRFVVLGACALMLAGCGPFVPVAKIDDSQAVELQKTVPVFSPEQTPKTARVLGPVEATSCRNKLWDKPSSEADATNQLSLYARNLGANAVGNVVCEPFTPTSLITNCWSSITCRGTAISVGTGPIEDEPVSRRKR